MSIAPAQAFIHPALFYRDDAEYLAGTVPFIREGLDADEPVAVAVPGRNLEIIRDALGVDAGRVLLRDMTVAGRNPGRILPTVLLAFADSHPGRRVRLIGEPIWAGRSAAEYPACAQHEALINAAFIGRPATILCPYNTDLLDASWIADAYTTHPLIFDATGRYDSAHYDDPLVVAAAFNQPLPAPPPDAAKMTVNVFSLAEVRRFATEHAARLGVTPERIADLMIAVSELASNAVRYGGGTGELAIWHDGDHLVCRLTDCGHLRDPLAGRIPVSAHAPDGGRGLLLVNQLCDLVRVHTTPAGTSTQIYLHRPVTTETARS